MARATREVLKIAVSPWHGKRLRDQRVAQPERVKAPGEPSASTISR